MDAAKATSTGRMLFFAIPQTHTFLPLKSPNPKNLNNRRMDAQGAARPERNAPTCVHCVWETLTPMLTVANSAAAAGAAVKGLRRNVDSLLGSRRRRFRTKV